MRAIRAVRSIAPRGSEFMGASGLSGWPLQTAELQLAEMRAVARRFAELRPGGLRLAEPRLAEALPWARPWEVHPPRWAGLPRRPSIRGSGSSLAWAEAPWWVGSQRRRVKAR